MKLARDNLMAFTCRMNPLYEPADHLWQICAALHDAESGAIRARGLKGIVITIPPRHGKSELSSIHFPAWYLGRNPDNRIIGGSYSGGLSFKFSRRARNLMRDALWPFPGIQTAGDLSGVHQWDIDGHRGGYFAASVEGFVAGHGGNILLIDDPVGSAEDARSAVKRDSAWEWFTQDAVTRVEPGGTIILIGTRWHQDDLIGRVLEQEPDRWVHIDLPAINARGEALWPERWPVSELAERKASMTAYAWEALYQQRPSPPGGGTFKKHWWQTYDEPPPLVKIMQFMDSAFKTGVGNDYSVIATWGMDAVDRLYVLDVWRKRVEYPDLLFAAHSQYATWQSAFPELNLSLVIEDKASGQSAIQSLRRPMPVEGGDTLPALSVIGHPVPAGSSKESRADDATPPIAGGRVFLPNQGKAEWVKMFIDEHANFPTGTHDDMVDTTSMAIARLAGPKPRVYVA